MGHALRYSLTLCPPPIFADGGEDPGLGAGPVGGGGGPGGGGRAARAAGRAAARQPQVSYNIACLLLYSCI